MRLELCTVALALASCSPDVKNGDSETQGSTSVCGHATDSGIGESPGVSSTTSGESNVGAGCTRLAGGDGVEWAVRCGSSSSEFVRGVTVDTKGDVYVAVEVRSLGAPPGLIDFDGNPVTPGELSDIVILKLDSEGGVAWAMHLGGEGDQQVRSIDACESGFSISGYADPATLELGGGSADGHFIAAFDENGKHKWNRGVQPLSAEGYFWVEDLRCGPSSEVGITGGFRGDLDLGGGKTLASSTYDGFVIVYDAQGNLSWAKKFGNEGGTNPFGRGLSFSSNGDVALVGSTDGDVQLGDEVLAPSMSDALVAVFSSGGEHKWSLLVGALDTQYGSSVAFSGEGELVIGGRFLNSASAAGITYGNVFPDASPDITGTVYDVFLVGMHGAGVIESFVHVGTKLNDSVEGLHLDEAGTVVVSGEASGKFTIRSFEMGLCEQATWSWSTLAMDTGHTVLSGDSIILGGSVGGVVDLGSGPLFPRGEEDLLVAKISRPSSSKSDCSSPRLQMRGRNEASRGAE